MKTSKGQLPTQQEDSNKPEPIVSIFNPKLIITKDKWAVSIVMHNKNDTDLKIEPEHAFLIIQSPELLYRKEFGPSRLSINIRVERAVKILQQLSLEPQYKDGKIQRAMQRIGLSTDLNADDITEQASRLILSKPDIYLDTFRFEGVTAFLEKINDALKEIYPTLVIGDDINPSMLYRLQLAEDNKKAGSITQSTASAEKQHLATSASSLIWRNNDNKYTMADLSHKTWLLDKSKAGELFANIEKDQENPPPFTLVGAKSLKTEYGYNSLVSAMLSYPGAVGGVLSGLVVASVSAMATRPMALLTIGSIVYAASSMFANIGFSYELKAENVQKEHNCATWATEHLQRLNVPEINAELTTFWGDYAAYITSRHIGTPEQVEIGNEKLLDKVGHIDNELNAILCKEVNICAWITTANAEAVSSEHIEKTSWATSILSNTKGHYVGV